MSDDLEDFDDPHADPVAELLLAAESMEWKGMPVLMGDSAMAGAQSIGLALFNLDADKMLDSENIYPGQLSDAIKTIFFCLCQADAGLELPSKYNPKWKSILRKRTIGRAMIRPAMFEVTLQEFAEDFKTSKDMAALFETFNELWGQFFKTEVELTGGNKGGGASSPGKPQSQPQKEPQSPAKSTAAPTKKRATKSRPAQSTSRSPSS